MKTLIAYFSAENGRTKALAQRLAALTDGDLFEIEPQQPYTSADLNYMNPLARCNREQILKKDVPVKNKVADFDTYDQILIGFPIWYHQAPRVILSFCEGYDFKDKKVALFATSGGSDIGKTAQKLAPYIKNSRITGAEVLNNVSDQDLKDWLNHI